MELTNLVTFLNQNAGVLSTIFSCIVMFATVVYAFLTASLVKETRRMREFQTEPRIEVTAHPPSEELFSIIILRVKNIGLGPAYDVEFKLSGELQSTGENELIQDFSKTQFLVKGLRYLGPGQEVRSGFTQMTQNYEEKIKSRLIVEASYNSATGKSYKDTIFVYFDEFEGYCKIGTPPLYAISNAMEKIEKNLSNLVTGRNKLQVDTFSENDRRKEAENYERLFKETSKQNGHTDS